MTLTTGLVFDEMRLDYSLIDAVDNSDPADPQPIDTTLGGLLPIFGAPENNNFSPGIVYVPEPTTISGACLLGAALILGRRRHSIAM